MKANKRHFMAICILLCMSLVFPILSGCTSTPATTKPTGGGATSPGVTTTAAPEDKFPEQDFELLIGFAAGGGTDLNLRALAESMAKEIGKSIVVTNMEGGNGVVSEEYALRQQADGYTLLAHGSNTSSSPTMGVTELTHKDVEMIGISGGDVPIISVPYDSPIKDMNDLIAGLKAGNLKSADSAIGGVWWVSSCAIANLVGGKFSSVPYGSGSNAAVACAKKETDFCASALNEGKGMIAEKMLRALCVMDTVPAKVGDIVIPPITDYITDPTFVANLPYFKSWRGIAVKPGTPQARKDKLIAAFSAAIETPEFKKFVEQAGLTEINLFGADADAYYKSAEAFTCYLLFDAGAGTVDPAKLGIERLPS